MLYRPRVPLVGKCVLVAMSGGVDSSAVASLLAGQGAEIIGVTFKNYCFSEDDSRLGRSCCSADAVADAWRVCETLGLRHVVVDETDRFRVEVMEDFEREYRAGRTPNPCVRCNSAVRFPRLLEEADRLGCDYVATGHFARIVELEPPQGRELPRARVKSDDQIQPGGGQLALARGLDGAKDQSYFLAAVDPIHHPRILFPLGTFDKPGARKVARGAGLHVHGKAESQDVCFIGDASLRDYLDERDLLNPGEVVDVEGKKLGEHPGAELFTIGQRRGLGVAMGKPAYVTDIDVSTGRVVLGDEQALRVGRVEARSAWLHESLGDAWSAEARADAGVEASSEMDPHRRAGIEAAAMADDGAAVRTLSASIRYRSPARPLSSLSFVDGKISVEFAESVSAVAPGQSIVIYAGDLVVGHGVIETAE